MSMFDRIGCSLLAAMLAVVAYSPRPLRQVTTGACASMLILVVTGFVQPARGGFEAVVEVEEVITSYTPADNGAGPLWCYGSTVIGRVGDQVFCSIIETGRDVPPLCNTRWQLWRRGQSGGWSLARQEAQYRQREPCPLAVFHDGAVFLSVNPSTEPPGTKYGPCRPQVLGFDAQLPSADPKTHAPAWAGGATFTDHSYRGLAADGERGELLLLNINARTSEQFVSFRDDAGKWRAAGTIAFPIRAAYPQVALRNRAAHVLAIGDIVEPVEQWRRLKYEKTRRQWDYVFRRLFYTYTPDIDAHPFVRPIEVDTVEKTGGHITNLDLHVAADGAAHLLYLKRPHLHAFIRDRFFPGEPMTVSLEYMMVENGQVRKRTTLAEAPSDRPGLAPTYGRFHLDGDARLYVVAAGAMTAGDGNDTFGNYIGYIGDGPAEIRWQRLDLAHPFRSFMTASPRAGTKPSEIIDLFGIADDSSHLRYARVRVSH